MLTFNPMRWPIRWRLGTAAALAAFTVSMASGLVGSSSAYAEPKGSGDNGVRYAVRTGPGSYEFYLPGETITVVDEHGYWHYYTCLENGGWIETNPAIRRMGGLTRPTLVPATTLQR